jgi:FG-GAP-like repeat
VVTADFNNDHRLDIAVANVNSNSVSVLLGNPDGSFAPAVASGTGAGPFSLAEGDFNGDGKLDLVTANASSNDLSVLLGDGQGGFGAPASVPLSGDTSPASVAVGDFNDDGKLDLGAVTNFYSPGSWGWDGWSPGYYLGYANVMLGTGAGTFAAPVSSFLDYGYHAGAAGADFNGDGKDDLATANTDYSRVSVLLGTSTGLGAVIEYSTGAYPRAVAVGDFTGTASSTSRPRAFSRATATARSNGCPPRAPVTTPWRRPTSTAMASSIWRRPTTATWSASGWAPATATSRSRSTSLRAAGRARWRPATSMATAGLTWRPPTPAPTTPRCCSTTGPGPRSTPH